MRFVLADLAFITPIANHFGGVACHYRPVGHIFRHYAAHAHHSVIANGHTIDYAGLSANPHIFTYNNTFGVGSLLIDGRIWRHAMVEGINSDIIGDAGLAANLNTDSAAIEGATMINRHFVP